MCGGISLTSRTGVAFFMSTIGDSEGGEKGSSEQVHRHTHNLISTYIQATSQSINVVHAIAENSFITQSVYSS